MYTCLASLANCFLFLFFLSYTTQSFVSSDLILLFIIYALRDSVSCNYTGKVSSGLERCGSLITPCGGLVFAGASNGRVHVWNSSTGELFVSFIASIGTMCVHTSYMSGLHSS